MVMNARFEVCTTMRIQVLVSWVVTQYSDVVVSKCFKGLYCFQLHPEDGGSMALQNVGILLRHCLASEPRRPCLKW